MYHFLDLQVQVHQVCFYTFLISWSKMQCFKIMRAWNYSVFQVNDFSIDDLLSSLSWKQRREILIFACDRFLFCSSFSIVGYLCKTTDLEIGMMWLEGTVLIFECRSCYQVGSMWHCGRDCIRRYPFLQLYLRHNRSLSFFLICPVSNLYLLSKAKAFVPPSSNVSLQLESSFFWILAGCNIFTFWLPATTLGFHDSSTIGWW